MDRYMAAFMADKVGNSFDARISGVTRFGLFVTIDASGASGLVPMRALPDDYWILDEQRHTLTGRHSGTVFAIGALLPVRLTEANAVTGGLAFTPDLPATQARRKARPGRIPPRRR